MKKTQYTFIPSSQSPVPSKESLTSTSDSEIKSDCYIYAAIAIALLTALNIVGLQQGKWTQNLLSAAKVLGLLLVVIIGLTAIPNSATPVESASSGTWGLAMVFVLLSYGGWNEAAYICAEI